MESLSEAAKVLERVFAFLAGFFLFVLCVGAALLMSLPFWAPTLLQGIATILVSGLIGGLLMAVTPKG